MLAQASNPGRMPMERRLMIAHRIGPYLVLLPEGVAMPHLLPAARCALTAPFHPYLLRGGLLSVALPWGCPRRTLSASVSQEARTFLTYLKSKRDDPAL